MTQEELFKMPGVQVVSSGVIIYQDNAHTLLATFSPEGLMWTAEGKAFEAAATPAAPPTPPAEVTPTVPVDPDKEAAIKAAEAKLESDAAALKALLGD